MDTRTYHRLTKHSLASLRAGPHGLDWPNQPIPYKLYTDLPSEPLPRSLAPGATPALDVIAGRGRSRGEGERPDRAALARLLYFSLGIVRRQLRSATVVTRTAVTGMRAWPRSCASARAAGSAPSRA